MFKRKIYSKIVQYLKTNDVIVIHGARQVGKTSLMHLLMSDILENKYCYLDLEDSRFIDVCDGGPDKVIEYLTQKGYYLNDGEFFYLFIDEIQYLENPSSFIKLFHDHYKNIKLVVSGSSSFEIKSKFRDSLVGRTVNFELYPLDFEEFLYFKGYYNQYGLVSKVTTTTIQKELVDLFYEYVRFGGYPKIVLTKEIIMKEKYLQQIIDTYVKKDIRDIGKIKDIEKFNRLLKVLAEQSGKLLNVRELANTTGLSMQTIDEYLFIMENTYILKKVTPYHNNIRSELFKMPKIFFYDTGIRNMLIYRQLVESIDGNVFETAIFSELIKNLPCEQIHYWRTQTKKEIDFILDTPQKLIPLEVKINATQVNKHFFDLFVANYKTEQAYIVYLQNPHQNINSIYPWEISNIFEKEQI